MPLLSISDELCRRAQKAAETQGKTLEQFVGEVLSNAVGELLETNQRNEIPVVRVPPGSPPINLTAVRRILEEDGF